MDKATFALGRIPVPAPVAGDAYTVAGECLAGQEAREISVYNFTNRYSPANTFPDVAKDSRMVFYGLTEFIRSHLTKPVTHDDVDKSVWYMNTAHSFGGPLKFDPKPWRRVVDEFGGYLPLRIQAIQEGSVFFPNEPAIQVRSLDKGFGEIAAMIEAIMVGMVSIASAKVTLYRHWLERIKEWCKLDDNEAMAQFMIHDFGMRASSCAEESELLGKAQLLVFHGTDTFNAAYQARVMGAKAPTGTSILALAHRIVQGYNTEREAYENLMAQDNIGSYVADCYDFHKAVDNYLVPMAKANPGKTIVARPDSGDFLENVIYIAKKALEHGLVIAPTEPNQKYAPANLKQISGDSMTPRKVELVFRELQKNGFAPTKWGIFGVGGYGRNTPNRDILSSAYKLCAKGEALTPVIKLSDSLSKMSVPGPTDVRRYKDTNDLRPTVFLCQRDYHSFGMSAYRDYYNGGISGVERYGDPCVDDFTEIQDRTINNFNFYDKFSERFPDFGLRTQTCLSDTIIEMQDDLYKQHKD